MSHVAAHCASITAAARAQRGAKRANGRTPGCPLANLSGELSTHEPVLRRKLQRVYAEMQKRFEDTLRAAVAAGEIPRRSDVSAKAEALVAIAQGGMLLSAVHDDPGTCGRLSELAQALLRA